MPRFYPGFLMACSVARFGFSGEVPRPKKLINITAKTGR